MTCEYLEGHNALLCKVCVSFTARARIIINGVIIVGWGQFAKIRRNSGQDNHRLWRRKFGESG